MQKLLSHPSRLSRAYPQRPAVEKILLLSCLFSFTLSLARVLYTGRPMFLFLTWNLFLAFLPYLITRSMMASVRWVEGRWRFAMGFMAWLLLVPNSFYIITDLFHLEERSYIPLWFDLALIFSYAWNGLLLGILSMQQMELMVQLRWRLRSEWLFVLPVMFLNAFGIYLGRYLRYNSWDVVANPWGLGEDLVYLVSHPLRNRFDWSMICCYTIFMSIVYMTLKRIAAGIDEAR